MKEIEPKYIMPENCYYNPNVVKCPNKGHAFYSFPCEGCSYNPDRKYDYREGDWKFRGC